MRFLLVRISIVDVVLFSLAIVSSSSLLCCLEKAVLRDCNFFCVTSLIVLVIMYRLLFLLLKLIDCTLAKYYLIFSVCQYVLHYLRVESPCSFKQRYR